MTLSKQLEEKAEREATGYAKRFSTSRKSTEEIAFEVIRATAFKAGAASVHGLLVEAVEALEMAAKHHAKYTNIRAGSFRADFDAEAQRAYRDIREGLARIAKEKELEAGK